MTQKKGYPKQGGTDFFLEKPIVELKENKDDYVKIIQSEKYITVFHNSNNNEVF